MQSKALDDIQALGDYYDIEIKHADHDTELDVEPDTVDDYMEALSDAWGLEWHNIKYISDQQPDILAGKKRHNEFWNEHDRKTQRIRGEGDSDKSDRGAGDNNENRGERAGGKNARGKKPSGRKPSGRKLGDKL